MSVSQPSSLSLLSWSASSAPCRLGALHWWSSYSCSWFDDDVSMTRSECFHRHHDPRIRYLVLFLTRVCDFVKPAAGFYCSQSRRIMSAAFGRQADGSDQLVSRIRTVVSWSQAAAAAAAVWDSLRFIQIPNCCYKNCDSITAAWLLCNFLFLSFVSTNICFSHLPKRASLKATTFRTHSKKDKWCATIWRRRKPHGGKFAILHFYYFFLKKTKQTKKSQNSTWRIEWVCLFTCFFSSFSIVGSAVPL